MDIRFSTFYFFSIERLCAYLPTTAKYVRTLQATGGDTLRECALIQLENFAQNDYPGEYLVIIPRHGQTGLFGGKEDPLFVNVFDGTDFKGSTSIDLSASNLELIDLGGVSLNKTEAERWQVNM